ncbi:apolipoprotein N-acyltransferase [Rhodothalassium salexigens]|uniref:apolipoprotein N-acyltransferase n=1 Tax=Rhodothalassium salexigens TaxID=1086 RepID=UPI001912FE99|nr:apolipoprotein N-acyltransferase [Rhodothalassium salexigens]MBK5912534.1 apolipoprotein N-acyltransferase [Rhodothalassium salexigens]MBK5921858.1 apolipoprotein N-acyltransferase [Rhodothalassium salexigens]
MTAPVASLDPAAAPLGATTAARLVRPVWRRLMLAAGLGALTAFAFAPLYWLPVLWLGFPGLALLLDQARSPRGLALTAAGFAVGHFLASIWWVGESFLHQSSVPEAWAPVAVLALAVALAAFYAVPFWAAARLGLPAARGARLALYAGLWVLAEWLRGHLFTGFPWNPLSAVWTLSAATMQPLAWAGPWLFSLATALAAFAPAALLPPHRPGTVTVGAATLTGFAALMAAGAARLPDTPQPVQPDITLRIVQPDIPQAIKWQRDLRGRHFARHLAMSEPGRPTDGRYVVIWSEAAVPYFLDRDPGRRRIIAEMLPPGGLLLTGQQRYAFPPGAREPDYYNSVVAIDPEARVRAVYDKAHLVPFGEYLPLEAPIDRLLAWLGTDLTLSSFAYGRISMQAGPGLRTLDLDGLPPFSPLVCYEGIFPGQVVAPGPRPQWLLNVSNDGWFGSSWGPYQHLALARMRAVEEGLPMVRAAGRGISAIIDPYGRFTGRTDLLVRTTLTGALPKPLDHAPPAAHIAPWLAGLLLALWSLGFGPVLARKIA